MRIAFVTGGLPFHGNSLNQTGIGGSETAIICMARELAKRSHQIDVFCKCDHPGRYANVNYYDETEFTTRGATAAYDVLVASRWADPLATRVPAGLRVLWNHDMCRQDRAWVANLYQTDLLLCLSDYHVQNFVDTFPELAPHIWKTSNGVDMQEIDNIQSPKSQHRLLYSSRPERGLLPLLRDIMPRLIEQHPDVVLQYCAYDLSQAMTLPPDVVAVHEACDRLAAQMPRNVEALGSLTKRNLYEVMGAASVVAYPCTFPEISCITAMEAQAVGTPIVTTNAYALPETVGPRSCLIDGTPGTADYTTRFVNEVLQLFSDRDHYRETVELGREHIESNGYTWAEVAETWEKKFCDFLDHRANTRIRSVIDELVRNNDLVNAQMLSQANRLPALKITAPDRRLAPAREIASQLQSPIDATQILFRLVTRTGIAPQRVVHYSPTNPAVSLLLAAHVPECNLTIVAETPRDAGDLRQAIETLGLKNVRVVHESAEEANERQADLLILDDFLDSQPRTVGIVTLMADLQKKYLGPDGVVALTTRYGADYAKVPKTAVSRYRNFDVQDLQEMFGDSRLFATCFAHEGVSESKELRGRWCTVFQRNLEIRTPRVVSKAMRTRPYESIAVCMIVGNEEDWIGGAIKSVREVADRVAVLCNNSTDDTWEICTHLGAEVSEADFDNFSQLRNLSKQDATEDWILVLDADERVVNAHQLRRYLTGEIFNAISLRQNHLTLDRPMEYDVPTRCFRNRPEYQFTGYIHEHCEDTAKGPFDNSIEPAVIPADIDIVHYGYTTETVRRAKIRRRNIELLIRDVQDHPQRLLAWVLAARDLLHFVKWHLERHRSLEQNSLQHQLLQGVIDIWDCRFDESTHRYRKLAWAGYQEALELMAKHHLPCRGSQAPPVEVQLALAGSIGGLQQEGTLEATSRWFPSSREYLRHIWETSTRLYDAISAPGDEGILVSGPTLKLQPTPNTEHIAHLMQAGWENYTGAVVC